MQHLNIKIGDSVSHAPGEKLVVRPKNKFIGDYSLMFHYGMNKAAGLVYEAMPTLVILLNNVERENLVRIRTTKIAQLLGVSLATVDRHMSKLRKLGLIVPDEAEGDKKSAIFNWRVCPFLAWKGHGDSLVDYVKLLPPDHSWFEYADPVVFKQAKNVDEVKL